MLPSVWTVIFHVRSSYLVAEPRPKCVPSRWIRGEFPSLMDRTQSSIVGPAPQSSTTLRTRVHRASAATGSTTSPSSAAPSSPIEDRRPTESEGNERIRNGRLRASTTDDGPPSPAASAGNGRNRHRPPRPCISSTARSSASWKSRCRCANSTRSAYSDSGSGRGSGSAPASAPQPEPPRLAPASRCMTEDNDNMWGTRAAARRCPPARGRGAGGGD